MAVTAKTIARLKARLAIETNPLERTELQRRINAAAREIAARDYYAKAHAIRRDLVGAYGT